ncbi:MAG: hypothetical protein QME45_13605 [Clostridiales bacterium]|nr:hypothetical protein [Clostridiales bacterium]
MDNKIQEKKVTGYAVGHNRKKYNIASLVILGIILSVQVVIFFNEIILSLKSYKPVRGMSGSSWVGFSNFSNIFRSDLAFSRILQNTIVFNLLFCIIVFLIALIIGYIVLALPKGGILRCILAILCVFPLFLPAEVYAGWFINLLGSGPFMNPSAITFIHPLLSAIKYAGIPIMLIYILDEIHEEKDPSLSLKVSGLFSIVSLAFIANSCFSLTRAIYNPLTYESLDMLDTYMYRKGFMQMDISQNSALGVIQTLITLLSFAVLFIPVKHLFSRTFKKSKIKIKPENIAKKSISSIIAIVIFTIIYFLPYWANGQSFDMNTPKPPIASPIIYYLLLSLISALIASALAAIIGKSFISSSKKVVIAAVVLLSLMTVLTAKPINFYQYLMVRKMGFINTGFAIILVTCFSSAAVWAMACILRMEGDISPRSHLTALAGVFLIESALIYCNSTPPLIYFTNIKLSPLLILKGVSSGMQQPTALQSTTAGLNNAVGLYGFIVSLPPLLIFAAANIILPKKHLMPVISGGMKS